MSEYEITQIPDWWSDFLERQLERERAVSEMFLEERLKAIENRL